MRIPYAFALLVYFCATSSFCATRSLSAAPPSLHNWPQWRGPLATGAAPKANPPLEWSESKNIRWKVPLPGSGHSSPVVWNERVFVMAAIPYGKTVQPKPDSAPGAHDNLPVTHHHRFVVMAFSRKDGKILWQRTVHQELPHEGGHRTGSLVSASPITDGKHVIAFFGSRGLYCLDVDGTPVWNKTFGRMDTKHAHGEGSSPVLYDNTLVVNWDHEGQSFIAAMDKSTGRQLWKKPRDEVTSWATPIVAQQDGRPVVIVSGTLRVRAYDLAGGDVIWECGGLSHNIVASPVANDEMVFAASSYEKRALLAIRLPGAKGDITGTERVAWSRIRSTPYVPSPLLYRGSLYFLRHYQGILTKLDAKTGAGTNGALRLGPIRNVYASPVAAAGRVYITDLDGTTVVVSHDDQPKPLAQNWLNDRFSASMALVDRDLFLRGEKFLYCISEQK